MGIANGEAGSSAGACTLASPAAGCVDAVDRCGAPAEGSPTAAAPRPPSVGSTRPCMQGRVEPTLGGRGAAAVGEPSAGAPHRSTASTQPAAGEASVHAPAELPASPFAIPMENVVVSHAAAAGDHFKAPARQQRPTTGAAAANARALAAQPDPDI